jgi:1,4-alpha-glucan branching enzyme
VDWRLLAPKLPPPYGDDDRDPAGVIKFQGGRLLPSDPGGEIADWSGDTSLNTLPQNNQLVMYELPASWTRFNVENNIEVGVGSFRDVIALIERTAQPANFPGILALEAGQAQLEELGINALELLPPADSYVDREWGYATSNYFAADFDLGLSKGNSSPTASTDLVRLIKTCHNHGIRFFADVVMAFATRYSYQNINFLDFHVQRGTGDPEDYRADGKPREDFSGDLFKYNFCVTTYDPISGETKDLIPSRQLMRTYLKRWMLDFRLDGIRLDSIVNIVNWDFVEEFKNAARKLWQDRWNGQGHAPAGADARFLVVGEELAVPIALLDENRLDGLWNEHFKKKVRYAITGNDSPDDSTFEDTVRDLIDCRRLGFQDGAKAINYVTSHDVGGFRNERLYNFLNNNGVFETEKPIKLAFVCLLTAVGVPMILAGEEFADQHDLTTGHPDKQRDAVNFQRAEDDWRKRIFAYVSRLVRLRTSYAALAVNDTDFIHIDFNDGKRVLAWKRGKEGSDKLVVVVANFSAWGTDVRQPDAEYVVHNWPATPAGKTWREVTQGRTVPPQWVSREPLYPWEGKVYALM